MQLLDLFILAVATWRLSYMLTSEPGLFRVFDYLRKWDKTGVTKCLYCTSVWVGFAATLLWHFEVMWLAYPFAISGLAIMLKHYTGAGFNG